MAFEQTRFTIVANAAGSGSWRFWNYIPSADSAEDDLTAPGYFGGMEGHIHSGDLLLVATPKVVALMAFAIADEGIVAMAMTHADMPASNMQPTPQVLPGGSQPVEGPSTTADQVTPDTLPADDDAKEEQSKEVIAGEADPEPVQPPPVAGGAGQGSAGEASGSASGGDVYDTHAPKQHDHEG